VIHAAGKPLKLAASVREQVRAIDAKQPVAEIQTMDEIIGGRPAFLHVVDDHVRGVGRAAGSGNLRSAVVLGVAAHAGTPQILGMIARDGVTLAETGVAIGSLAALALTRVLQKQLFEVAPTDQSVFIGTIAMLLLVAMIASLFPAIRAVQVDPNRALRDE
jgi:putative ABC transport system permease protein